MALSAIE